MRGLWKRAAGPGRWAIQLNDDQCGAGVSIQTILLVAVAVLLLAAVLRMARDDGGAIDQTKANLDGLVNGSHATGSGTTSGTPIAPQSKTNAWVPPTIASAPDLKQLNAPIGPVGASPLPSPGSGLPGRVAWSAVNKGAVKLAEGQMNRYLNTLAENDDAFAEIAKEEGKLVILGAKSIIGASVLLTTESRSRQYIREGRYREAWENNGDGILRFIGNVVMASPHLSGLGIAGKIGISEGLGYVGRNVGGAVYDWKFDDLNYWAHDLASHSWWPKGRGPRVPLDEDALPNAPMDQAAHQAVDQPPANSTDETANRSASLTDAQLALLQRAGQSLDVQVNFQVDFDAIMAFVRRLLESCGICWNSIFRVAAMADNLAADFGVNVQSYRVVSPSDVRAAYSRTVLREAGLDVADIANARVRVSVAVDGRTTNDGDVHSDRYFNEVNQRLRTVRGKGGDELRRVLAEIDAEIGAGTFPR